MPRFVAPEETLAGTLAQYDHAAQETDAVIAEIPDLGQRVPVPPGVAWFPGEVTAWSLRWVLRHLIEETTRHAGHAEIIRESLDGATALLLMAAMEKWPANPWVQPWEASAPNTSPHERRSNDPGVTQVTPAKRPKSLS